MHKLYTSSYDASIYLQQPEQNAGRDEILEVGKLYYGSTKDLARTLIKFDVSNLETGSGWKTYLNLKAAGSEEIPLEYTIYANAISQSSPSWTMGTGTKFDNITSDGVSWKYKNGVNTWQDNTIGGTAYYVAGTTGSANAEGGTWYTTSQASQSFNYQSDDVRMDVTDIVKLWVSSSLPNNGFIIHHNFEAEENTLDYGLLKFFSKETHTIYEPTLEVVWDDSSFAPTGSMEAMPEDNFKVLITNLKSKYTANSKVKIKVRGRELFPIKSFADTFNYSDVKYLPQTSYYQLEDYLTEEVIFPFGNYTKISCDTNGSYFVLDLQSLPIDRIYKLKLKVVIDGIDYISDEKYTFQII
jgi:hypothetical protein